MAALVGLGTVASIGGIDGSEPGADAADSSGFELASDVDQQEPTSEAGSSRDGTDSDATTATEQQERPSTTAMPTEAADADDDPPPLDCLTTEPEGLVWRLAFAEDFAGPTVEADDWDLYDSPGNAGFGLRRPSAIAVRDGILVITAQMIDDTLVTGGMAHRDNQVYGRWEFRVRTDPDPSEATSGVVLTWPESENWPIDGENDMYETGRDPDRSPFQTFVHYGTDNSQEFLTHDADGTRWHTIAMEWTADRIAMYRDGDFVGEITDPIVIPDVSHHMTIQLDAWADTMGEPVRMEVDWVRIHRLDPTATAC